MLYDDVKRLGVERTVTYYENDIVKILEEYPETPELANEVRKIREYSIKNNGYLLDKLVKNCSRLGIDVYIASTRDDAVKYIMDVVGVSKTIVKSKSMVSEELDLRRKLVNSGNYVWETDLGEFILQLADDYPMHIVTPSIHYSKERVAKLFTRYFKREFKPENVEEMVKYVSDFLRKKYFEAEYGIIGSNSVSVEEPASLLIHNEGNISMTYSTPDNLIILTDILKLTPKVKDSIKIALVTSRYAGYRIAGYYDVIYYKALLNRGKNLHLVILDGGRSKLIADKDFWEAGLCIKCGACMYACTVFQLVGGAFGGPFYPSGIGAIITSFTFGLDKNVPSIYNCLLDGRCRVACPINIDIPSMILKLRNRIVDYTRRSM